MKIDADTLNSKELDKLNTILKKNKVNIKVGILKGADTRTQEEKDGSLVNSENNNATIGLYHEFGSEDNNLPERSFLRMPLSMHYFSRLENSGLFEKSLENSIKEYGLKTFAEKLKSVALGTVLEAFNSGGYGEWEPSNMKRKRNHQTLVESTQLRKSISAEVDLGD